jgi:hypothetical protein
MLTNRRIYDIIDNVDKAIQVDNQLTKISENFQEKYKKGIDNQEDL